MFLIEQSLPYKAVALLSGGLDSMLAVLVMLRQGIHVSAIQFSTPFDAHTSGNVSHQIPLQQFEKRIFDITVRYLGTEMLRMVKNPKHGHGKNMNPCIDCRILMLKEARKFMDETGADFLVTGEVLGQRPMSQRKDMLYHIDKEAGVSSMVLRPLCAKLLRETIAEQEGIVERRLLFSFSGRSRKLQIALAGEFGLNDYPAPAGGCLLTEPNYAFRLKDLLAHDLNPEMRDIDLLKIGRHFRSSSTSKIVVGRDESENAIIKSLAEENDCLLRVEGCGSPMALVTGEITDESLRLAAAVCARYSDGKNFPEVAVQVFRSGKPSTLRVIPAGDEMLDTTRIGKSNMQVQSTV
jgi:tRNA U34 2-thiouridine synthase MnmA/TrmU